MNTAAELGRNPVSTRFSLSMKMSRLTRGGTAEPVSRDQILRRERGPININFPCSTDPEQDWQPSPVHRNSSYIGDHTYVEPVLCTTGKTSSFQPTRWCHSTRKGIKSYIIICKEKRLSTNKHFEKTVRRHRALFCTTLLGRWYSIA